jgi:hypothetical protein
LPKFRNELIIFGDRRPRVRDGRRRDNGTRSRRWERFIKIDRDIIQQVIIHGVKIDVEILCKIAHWTIEVNGNTGNRRVIKPITLVESKRQNLCAIGIKDTDTAKVCSGGTSLYPRGEYAIAMKA